jgi:anti-sigma B factor antagonist
MPDPLFRAALQTTDDGVRLELIGELDVSTAPELARHVDEIIAAQGDVRVDCSQLTFADSSGLDTLIRLAKALGAQERALVLTDVVPTVRRAIEVLRITDLVQLA